MDRNTVLPRSIRYLIAVAEHRSFTRAAEALFVSQPTLSQQIKQLEQLLDVQLLDRSGRTVRLTTAGEVYVRHAQRALGELDAGKRAIHDLDNLKNGSLLLATTPITDYLAAPLIEDFIVRYPGITVRMLVMPQHEISDALAEGRADLGIAFSNALSPIENPDMVDCHILSIESLSLVVGSVHSLAAEHEPLSKRMLERQPLILLSPDYVLRRHIDQHCLKQRITLNVAAETASLSVIMEIVRVGRLATILPDVIASIQSSLKTLLLLPEFPLYAVSLICRRGQHKSAACRAFGESAMKWAQTHCPRNPALRLQPCHPAELVQSGHRVHRPATHRSRHRRRRVARRRSR
jgi:LysR family cyn operon transcriptional activator